MSFAGLLNFLTSFFLHFFLSYLLPYIFFLRELSRSISRLEVIRGDKPDALVVSIWVFLMQY